jgi:hypothetical protein
MEKKMNCPKQEEYIFYSGERFQVEFYYTQKGSLPAKDYFDDSDRLVQIKLLAFVKYIAEHGKLFDETKFRLVDRKEKIYELKPMAERFFNFFTSGQKMIITNAYCKKRQKVDHQELMKAIVLKRDYEKRVCEGHYYAT